MEGGNKYKQFIRGKKRQGRRKAFVQYIRYAAVIALIMACTWTLSYLYFDYQIQNDIQYNTLSVPAGQHVALILSDGTEIWMNARTSIKYPIRFNRKQREVELKGEAYFKVTKNIDRPFSVITPSLTVNVRGTTFNVNSDSINAVTDVSLIEGLVEVALPNNCGRIPLLPMQNLNMKDGKIKISRLENENAFLWKQGILFFDKVPLSEIAKKI